MEDSEQRKKRLKEMRMQADQAEVSGGVEGLGFPALLSNPLIETSATTHSQDRSSATPRFDFYTDPMNAFSSKRRNNPHMQSAQDYLHPANFARFPAAQGPEATYPHMVPPASQVSPAPYRNPGWSEPRGHAHYNYPFRPSSGGNYPNPRFEPPGGPSYFAGQGIIPRPSHSPNPSTGYRHSPTPSRGRGRGVWHNTQSHVSGRGSGRGPTSHGHWSNRASGPDQFYKRSMVEDPWKLLSPVIWRTTDISSNTPGSSKPHISNSVNDEREGPSNTANKPGSEPSLAEYLAAAFNEVAENAENV